VQNVAGQHLRVATEGVGAPGPCGDCGLFP
jgi:hypothetical protein